MPLVPCPACGHSVSDQAPFCPQCGHPLREAPAQPSVSPSTVVVPDPEPAPAPEPPDPLRCVCGTWNRTGAVRCASCSRPLGRTEAGPRPIQYVHPGLVVGSPARDTQPGRKKQEDEAAATLGTVALACAVIALLVWPLFFGLIALACGIPAHLRGSRHALTSIVVAIVAMGLSLVVLLFPLW